MTNEEAINHIEDMANDLQIFPDSKQGQALLIGIKALEQESVLDKITAEIIDTGAYEQEVRGKTEFLKGINYCLDVIDKYKTESED